MKNIFQKAKQGITIGLLGLTSSAALTGCGDARVETDRLPKVLLEADIVQIKISENVQVSAHFRSEQFCTLNKSKLVTGLECVDPRLRAGLSVFQRSDRARGCTTDRNHAC